MEINADDLKQWYAAQELVYASRTCGNYTIRLTLSHNMAPIYGVVKRHIDSLEREQLYLGDNIDTAVQIFNKAVNP